MLVSLHIENVAIIKSVDIDFSKGFTVLTGETGAGKSIIIDSVNLLLGAKADKELIRNGADGLMVSGLFSDLSEDVFSGLAGIGVFADEEGNIFIQRSVGRDGRSSVKINGRTVSLSILKEVTPLLVSIHGQSDTRELSEPTRHLELLDVYAECGALNEKYSALYSKLVEIRKRISDAKEREAEGERLKEILEYQIKDIESVAPKPSEEDELIEKKMKLKNREKINRHADFVFKALKGSEKGSVSYLLDRSIGALMQISDVVPECAEYAEKLRDFLYETDSIAEDVYAVMDDEADPTESLNRIESRLDKLSKLKRKYGATLEEVILFCDKAKRELEELDNSESLIKSLAESEKLIYEEAAAVALELHEKRTSAAKILEKRVCEILEFLDMPKVVFFVSVKSAYKNGELLLDKHGADSVEFFISANKGADAQPIGKIASGGELARIMLALKCVLADKDGTLTVVFDEIDAGVSGKTARKIGIKMLALAHDMQIFCVTHSAQIASLADNHYLIKKSEIGEETTTSVRLLDDDGRVDELSRILGGINITDAQRAAAVDMLKEKSVYEIK